jgi:glycogen debranching enzyme
MARSQRQIHTRPRAARARSAVRGVRRVWPYVLMAWERWQSLSPEEKERYKKQARGYAERGRRALEAQRRHGGKPRK